jgi:ABC-2 type transport system permease protein
MLTEFIYTLRRLRGQMIGWGIGLALYGLLMVGLYDSIVEIEGISDLLNSYPPEILAFFGDITDLTSPEGYLDTYWFTYMTIIIGIFAASAGANLVVGDEEKGILDLVVAHPISRSALFWGRLLGFVVATAVILLISWLSWVIPSGGTGLNLTWIEILRPFVPLFAVLLLFGALATLLSLILPSARLAGTLSGGLIFANFLLQGLANLNKDLEAFIEYTPLFYYQAGDAIFGLNWGWLAGLLGVALLLALLAWQLFLRRDVRVGGEGGWRLPSLLLRPGRRAKAQG